MGTRKPPSALPSGQVQGICVAPDWIQWGLPCLNWGIDMQKYIYIYIHGDSMHSIVRHECIFILYAKPGSTSGHTLCLRQDDKHIMSDYMSSDNHLQSGYQSDYSKCHTVCNQ